MPTARKQVEHHFDRFDEPVRKDILSTAAEFDGWAQLCTPTLTSHEHFKQWQAAEVDETLVALSHFASLSQRLNLVRRALGIFLNGATLRTPYLGRWRVPRIAPSRCNELLVLWFDELAGQCRAMDYDKPLPTWGARRRARSFSNGGADSDDPKRMFAGYSDECARRVLVEADLGRQLLSLTQPDGEEAGPGFLYELAVVSTPVSQPLRALEAERVLEMRRAGLDQAVGVALRTLTEEQRALWSAWQRVAYEKHRLTSEINELRELANTRGLADPNHLPSQAGVDASIEALQKARSELTQDSAAIQFLEWQRDHSFATQKVLTRSAFAKRLIPIQRRIVKSVAAWLIRHDSVATASIPNIDAYLWSVTLLNGPQRARLVQELRQGKREAGEPETPTTEEIATVIAATVRARQTEVERADQ